MTLDTCKSLRLHVGASGQRHAKPLYGQKLYPGFESLPLRQIWAQATLKCSPDFPGRALSAQNPLHHAEVGDGPGLPGSRTLISAAKSDVQSLTLLLSLN